MWTVILPPGDNPIAINKYIISKEHCHFLCSLRFSVIRGNLGPVQLKISQFYHNTIENIGNVVRANTGTYNP